MESDTNSNTTVYNTISQFNNSDIETPDKFANSEPNPPTFSQPPFQSIHSQVKIEPQLHPTPISYVTTIYSPLTSEPSDNNDQDHTQKTHELDNFITTPSNTNYSPTLTIFNIIHSINPSPLFTLYTLPKPHFPINHIL